MIQIGAASRIITNCLGSSIQGASVKQIAKSIRDELEANALVIRDESKSVVLISCDIVGVEAPFHDRARAAIAAALNIEPCNVLVTCTHTHAGPSVIRTSYYKSIDEAYLARLTDWLVDVSRRALDNARPARIRLGRTELALGYNRRCCFSDNTHHMYMRGGADQFTGIEGPTDPSHIAMLVESTVGEPLALLHANAAHPTMFYGSDFFSADYPGEARKVIRAALGEIPVLYINGPFGDIAPSDPQGPAAPDKNQYVIDMGKRVADATLRVIEQASPVTPTRLDHQSADLTVPRRYPTPELIEAGRETLKRIDAGESIAQWDAMWAFARVLAEDRFADPPHETLPIQALRLDDFALVTHPCELYCQFGIDLKRRSPAPMTAIADVTNGYTGYCPTLSAIVSGGYSGDPLAWTRLAPEAGHLIVDAAANLLWRIWRNQ